MIAAIGRVRSGGAEAQEAPFSGITLDLDQVTGVRGSTFIYRLW